MSDTDKNTNNIEPIKVPLFTDAVASCYQAGERFCFILGAGASMEADIPPATSFMKDWLEDIKKRSLEKNIFTAEKIGLSKEELQTILADNYEPNSNDYFRVFELRYKYKTPAAYKYLEDKMSGKTPCYGHYALRDFLTLTDNRYVITTNFDPMVEDALAICGEQHPQIIPHEDLAKLIDKNPDKPVIIKVHRDLLYQPMNTAESMSQLDEKWKNPLTNILTRYTPIVIGYAGADHTLMSLLESLAQSGDLKKIYWVNPKIDDRVEELLLSTDEESQWIQEGFGSAMFKLHLEFSGSDIFTPKPQKVEEVLEKLYEDRKKQYSEQYKKLAEKETEPSSRTDKELSTEERQDKTETMSALLRNLPSALAGSALEYYLKADLASDQGNYEEAVALYNKAIELDPNDADAYNNRGVALHKLKRYEEALASYDKAIELDPNYATAYNNRGVALAKLERYKEALADYDKAIALDPNDATAYNNRGNALAKLERYKEAIASYDKAIALDPNLAEAHYNRGNALYDLERYEEAIASYDKAIALNPNYAAAYNNRGAALDDLKRYEEAIASYDKAIALDLDDALAYNNRGNALFCLDRYEEAIASYDKAIALNQDDAEAYNNRGSALALMGRYEEAIASFDKAIALDPDYAEAHYNRGLALKDMGRYEEAIASYDQAIALDPDYADAYNNCGNAFLKMDCYEEALDYVNKAIEIDEGDSILYDTRAEILLNLKRYEEALKDIDKAIELNPQEPHHQELRQDILSAMNNPDNHKSAKE